MHDETEAAHFALYAKDWWQPNGPFKTLHDINPARLQFIRECTELKSKKILDLGCGGGVLAEALALAGAEVIGLDIVPQCIEVAKEHATTLSLPLTLNYRCQAVEDLAGEGCFDIITCLEMLEHVSEPQAILQHCARLLKPQGLLFLSTINRSLKAYAQLIVAAEYLLKLLPRQTHDFKKFIKPSELAEMARKEGFCLQKTAGLNYNPFSRQAFLQEKVDVNYLMAWKRL